MKKIFWQFPRGLEWRWSSIIKVGDKKYNTNANTIKIYTIGLCNLLVTKDKIWSECKKIYFEKKKKMTVDL